MVAIFETATWLESKGVENTRGMNKGGSQMLGAVTVTMTHAIHSCGILDGDQIIYGGEASGYVLRLPDNRCIYFAGDTNVFTDMELIENSTGPNWHSCRSATSTPWARTRRPWRPKLLNVKRIDPHALRHVSGADRDSGTTDRSAQAEHARYRSLETRTRKDRSVVKKAPGLEDSLETGRLTRSK